MLLKMSKTLAELEAEFAEINRLRNEKQKAAATAAQEFTAASYKQNALAAEIEKARREERKDEDIGAKFTKARAEFEVEVAKHVKAAAESLAEAKKLSEKTGIPFESTLIDIESIDDFRGSTDIYVPKSFTKKWEALFDGDQTESDILDLEYGVYLQCDQEYGWAAAWAPSSMRC